MNDLEVMTTLFEAKLESLPDEIKSTYPLLQQCNLDDVNQVFSVDLYNNVQSSKPKSGIQDQGSKTQDPSPDPSGDKKTEEVVEEQKELSPEEELAAFLEQHGDFQSLFKMLKIGITIIQVEQKATLNGYDMDLFNEMVEKAKKVYPNIHWDTYNSM